MHKTLPLLWKFDVNSRRKTVDKKERERKYVFLLLSFLFWTWRPSLTKYVLYAVIHCVLVFMFRFEAYFPEFLGKVHILPGASSFLARNKLITIVNSRNLYAENILYILAVIYCLYLFMSFLHSFMRHSMKRASR